jgi:hypothetical protein
MSVARGIAIMFRTCVALFALIFAMLNPFSAQEASAESMTWKFRSYHKNIVNVELYSQNRRHIWPGGGEVYSLRDFDVHNVNITCVSGERICYGAWVRGNDRTYWGVGTNQRHRCEKCCYTCGGTTPVINLNE